MKTLLLSITRAIAIMAVSFFAMARMAVAQEVSDSWTYVQERNGIMEYVREVPNKSFFEAKATVVYPAHVENVVSKLRFPAHYTFWMDSTFSDWKVLEEKANGSYIVYAKLRMAHLEQARDVVLNIAMQPTANGCFVVMDNVTDFLPETADAIRIADFHAKVMVRTVGANGNISITAVNYVDFGGNISPELANVHATDIIAKMMNGMKNITEEDNTAVSQATAVKK